MAEPIDTDALVIGAGPVGLFQAFELGLLGVHTEIVDSLPFAGGQCIELYPDKPIYDIPSVVRCTGRELVANLLAQLAPFRVPMHLGQVLSTLRPNDSGGFDLETTSQLRFRAGAVVLAAGVGAFEPRRLKLPGIERFEGTQLFYRAGDADPGDGTRIVIGGDEGAVDAALGLASGGAAVTLVHRRDVFELSAARRTAFDAARAAGRVRVVVGQPVGFRESGGRLVALELSTPDDRTETVDADRIHALLGVSPKLGPLATWGLPLERKQVPVETAGFETGVPGIFAVGDVNTYPGKKKLIVSGFHEATLAAFAVAARLRPDEPTPLRYTTTSPLLQRRLGVLRDSDDAATRTDGDGV